MCKKDVLSVFRQFARCQGFYGRLLDTIGHNGENVGTEFWRQFRNCKSDLDVILAVEQ